MSPYNARRLSIDITFQLSLVQLLRVQEVYANIYNQLLYTTFELWDTSS